MSKTTFTFVLMIALCGCSKEPQAVTPIPVVNLGVVHIEPSPEDGDVRLVKKQDGSYDVEMYQSHPGWRVYRPNGNMDKETATTWLNMLDPHKGNEVVKP